MRSQFWESQPHLPSSGYSLSVFHCYAGWKPSRRPEAGAKVICKCICEGVCVCVQRQKDWTCLFSFGCLSKSKILSSFFFFNGWILNLIFTRWKWFSRRLHTSSAPRYRETKHPAYSNFWQRGNRLWTGHLETSVATIITSPLPHRLCNTNKH